MSLVAYSDSEGSDDETPQTKADTPSTKPASAPSSTNFAVDKANPRKIQVKLQTISTPRENDGEPAPKRPRIGAGGGRGFNAMLPAPKRDSDVTTATKPAARRVFSLKTGAEPGFSRESDAELRQLFAEQDAGSDQQMTRKTPDENHIIPSILAAGEPPPTQQPVKGNAFVFKPLSVARGNKKPKRSNGVAGPAVSKMAKGSAVPLSTSTTSGTVEHAAVAAPPKKISLFGVSSEAEPEVETHNQDAEDESLEAPDDLGGDEDFSFSATGETTSTAHQSEIHQAQSLDFIASDLNLSKADRRQLFGRRGHAGGTAINVVNFNTDQEYAANEALRASGEQVQHNPVRALASGKHSLKQLVSAATGQKEALEESFATGRRNKKEAGSKYGW